MKILVTGGAGFIGSHLVDALIARGHDVRVLDALVPQVHPDRVPRFVHRDAELIVGDVADRPVLDRALDDIDAVYHEAADVGVGQSMYEIARYVRSNDLATSVLLEAVAQRRDRIRKLIVASSMSIYGDGSYHCARCGIVAPPLRSPEQFRARRWEMECPRCRGPVKTTPTPEEKPLFPSSVYAITKLTQEHLCLVVGRAYGVPTVALRYFNVYGSRQALSNPYTGVCAIFAGRLLNDGRPIVFEDGNQTRDFTSVRDIVQANLLALATDRADYQAVNIGTGVPTSVNEVARLLATGLGKDLEPEILGRFREGDIRHCVADVSRARDLLGYAPQVSLADGMPELLEWVRHEKATDRVSAATAELESRRLVK